jgi:hypothetical protein
MANAGKGMQLGRNDANSMATSLGQKIGLEVIRDYSN